MIIYIYIKGYGMVLNATFNNISVISWRLVLLAEESGESRETTDMSQTTEKLFNIMLYKVLA